MLNNFLMIATQFGTDVSVQSLIENGASASFIDGKGDSLLHHVAGRAAGETKYEDEKQFREKIADTLIRNGAPLNHKNKQRHTTALMQAAQNHTKWLVEKLLRADAQKDLKDLHGETACDHAKKHPSPPRQLLDLLCPNK